jgi:hypothetical protein
MREGTVTTDFARPCLLCRAEFAPQWPADLYCAACRLSPLVVFADEQWRRLSGAAPAPPPPAGAVTGAAPPKGARLSSRFTSRDKIIAKWWERYDHLNREPSRKELAEALGISVRTLRDYWAGRRGEPPIPDPPPRP